MTISAGAVLLTSSTATLGLLLAMNLDAALGEGSMSTVSARGGSCGLEEAPKKTVLYCELIGALRTALPYVAIFLRGGSAVAMFAMEGEIEEVIGGAEVEGALILPHLVEEIESVK